MKQRIILLLLSILSVTATHAQKKLSCCAAVSVHGEVAMLSKDSAFTASHLPPAPVAFTAVTGEMVRFATKGAEGQAFLVRSPQPSRKYIFVFHEWWGLNDYIRREAEALQQALGNVNVLAIDLYDGQVATNLDSAATLMGAARPERCKEIIDGALAYAGQDAQIATLGWCFGGAWSLQAALHLRQNARACVIYYGMPETDAAVLKQLNCDVLGIFATQDKWISPEVVAKFEAGMKEAGKKLTVKNYDAGHAFANPSNPKYNEEYGKDAMKHVVAFLSEKLHTAKK